MGSSDILKEISAAGIGCAIADSIFNPLEIVKVRLQVEGGSGSIISSKRVYQEIVQIVRNDGFFELWTPGLLPTFLRGLLYAGSRIGMYPTVRNFINNAINDNESATTSSSSSSSVAKSKPTSAPSVSTSTSTSTATATVAAVTEEKNSNSNSNSNINLKVNSKNNDSHFLTKLLAGGLCGAVGSFIFSPLDLIRINFQKNPKIYTSTFSAFTSIYGKYGANGLWAGSSATVVRATMLSASQLSIYDQIKTIAVSIRMNRMNKLNRNHSRSYANKNGHENKNRNENGNMNGNRPISDDENYEKDDNFHKENDYICSLLEEGPLLHGFASLTSGIIAQGIIMPIDAVKTRIMISGSEIDGGGGRIFSGMNSSGSSSNVSNSDTSTSSSSSSGTHIHNTNVGNSVGNGNTSTIRTSTKTSTNVRTNTMLSAFSSILKEGGVGGFYRGFTPALMRQGPCILLQVRFQDTTSSTYSISVYIYVFFCQFLIIFSTFVSNHVILIFSK